MALLIPAEKRKILLQYPLVRAYISRQITPKIFKREIKHFISEWHEQGITDFEIEILTKLAERREKRLKLQEKLEKRYEKLELELYHATYTGENFERVNSFLNDGAKPCIAKGHGQGAGFYVWTNRKNALEHINFLRENSDLKGYPMLVIIKAEINPNDWDLDYEVNKGIVIKFFFDNFDLFQLIPDGKMTIEPWGKLIISSCTKNKRMRTITFVFIPSSGLKVKKSIGMSIDSNIGEGEICSRIFNYLQEHFREITRKAEMKFFHKINLPAAIKYIGKDPLPVFKTGIYINGKWVNGAMYWKKKAA